MAKVSPDDDVSLGRASKTVVVLIFLGVAAVAFSMAYEEGSQLDKLLCVGAGVGALFFAGKTVLA